MSDMCRPSLDCVTSRGVLTRRTVISPSLGSGRIWLVTPSSLLVKTCLSSTTNLFCLIHRMFFAEAVTEFLTTVIAAKIRLELPFLVLVDPMGALTNYIAARLAEAMPSPCEEKQRSRSSSLITEIGMDLVDEVIPRWLEVASGELPRSRRYASTSGDLFRRRRIVLATQRSGLPDLT